MAMPIIDLRDVPTRLPELLAWGEAGTEILVMDGTTPFAQYVPLVSPPLYIGQHKQQLFEDLFTQACAHPDTPLTYDCPYPKYEFLSYLAETKPLLIHGSNNPDIPLFEPRLTTDWAGRPLSAVYASADGIWPMFFAIVQRKPYPYSLRNGCHRVETGSDWPRKLYYFAVSARVLRDHPWTGGMIYLLSRASFEHIQDSSGYRTEEWASQTTVQPLGKLAISPEDFPFLSAVQGMEDQWSQAHEERASA